MQPGQDLVWEQGGQRMVVSPKQGGRVVSWVHSGQERVHPPMMLEGGVGRVMFAEETYPGTSYVTPHRVLSQEVTPRGFRIHMRHYWTAPNHFMRLAGWPEKINALHLDHLLLDKTITFDGERSLLTFDLAVTNVSGEIKYLTPWLHHAMNPWPAHRTIVVDGQPQDYNDIEIYWGCHLVRPGQTLRIVKSDAARKLHVVAGCDTAHMRGASSMMPVAGEFPQAPIEFRHDTVVLKPGQRWRCNSFLMLTDDWKPWATASPVALHSVVEDGTDTAFDADELTPMLRHWALAEETRRGVMALSFLDKLPFSSTERYHAANVFAGFHADEKDVGAEASVLLFATAAQPSLRVRLDAPPGWSLACRGESGASLTLKLEEHAAVRLFLRGPKDLSGKEKVGVRVSTGGDEDALTLRVDGDAKLEKRYPCAVKMFQTYLEERWRAKSRMPRFESAEAFYRWQDGFRKAHEDWMEGAVTGRCDPEPRLVERQEGPTCVREKWLIQVEPGQWMPGYLVKPRSGKRPQKPLFFFLHGSGPGKQMFAGDEDPTFTRAQAHHDLEFMPYVLATELDALVWVPDARACGEQAESMPINFPARMEALGLPYMALRTVDLVRQLDWLMQRPDLEPTQIASLGCSGGGGTTLYFAALDRRVTSAIVSSSYVGLPREPEEGFFNRTFIKPGTRLYPDRDVPAAPAHTATLIAPRQLWIMDGFNDLCYDNAEQLERWRKAMRASRDEIRRAYEAAGAMDKFRETWFDGTHCAGMTNQNMIAYYREIYGL